MNLRSHETDPKLTVATYKDEDEAYIPAEALAPLRHRPFIYLGLRDANIHENPTLTVLDDGQIEMVHKTVRLARFAGRVARSSAWQLSRQSKFVFEGEKKRIAMADTINQYISDEVMSRPSTPPYVKPEPTPNEQARDKAFDKIKQPFEKTLIASEGMLAWGLALTAAGRITEIFSQPQASEPVNETVRRVANDISASGLAVAGLSAAVFIAIGSGRVRNHEGFDAGWDAAVNHVDPDSQIEGSLQTELPQTQEPTQ